MNQQLNDRPRDLHLPRCFRPLILVKWLGVRTMRGEVFRQTQVNIGMMMPAFAAQ